MVHRRHFSSSSDGKQKKEAHRSGEAMLREVKRIIDKKGPRNKEEQFLIEKIVYPFILNRITMEQIKRGDEEARLFGFSEEEIISLRKEVLKSDQAFLEDWEEKLEKIIYPDKKEKRGNKERVTCEK